MGLGRGRLLGGRTDLRTQDGPPSMTCPGVRRRYGWVAPASVALMVAVAVSAAVSCERAGAAAPAPQYPSPLCIVFAPDGRHAYVSGHGTDVVYVIDVARRAVAHEVPVGHAPVGLAVSGDGRRSYVANSRSHSVSVVDTATPKVVATIPAGFEPHGLCLSPSSDGARLYVANHISNDVSVIDVAQQREIARVPVGRMPTFLALTPDGKRLLVGNRLSAMPATDPKTTSHVSVIDIATLKVVAEKKGPETMHVLQQTAVSPDGRYAYTVHLRPNFNITTAQLAQGWIQTNALTLIRLEGDDAPVTVLLDNVNSGAEAAPPVFRPRSSPLRTRTGSLLMFDRSPVALVHFNQLWANVSHSDLHRLTIFGPPKPLF